MNYVTENNLHYLLKNLEEYCFYKYLLIKFDLIKLLHYTLALCR